MIHRKKRVLLGVAVALVFLFGILSIAYADSVAQTIQAYTGVRIIYNNQELIDERPAYIINSSTYIPLKMLMDNFDKSISYEQSTNRVIIKDKADTMSVQQISELNNTISSLKAQLAKLQSENSTLTGQNTALTSENTALTSKITTLNNRIAALQDDDDDELTDIEDDLQDDYEDAGEDYLGDDEIEVYISVTGDDDDVELEVFLDFSSSDDNDDMEDLSYTTVKNLLKRIYDDLEDELDDSDDYDKADLEAIMMDDDGNELEYDGKSFDPTSW